MTRRRLSGSGLGSQGDFDRGEAALESLEQAHEVPHGEDVCFKKGVQVFDGLDRAIERVGGEPGVERFQTFGECGDAGVIGHAGVYCSVSSRRRKSQA